MTKRTNAELIEDYAGKCARLQRIEASKGDPRIAKALKLAKALRVFAVENIDAITIPCAESLEGRAAQWVDEFFAPTKGEQA